MKNLTAWLTILTILLALSGCAANQPAAGWPRFQGPLRTGVSPDTGLAREWPASGPRQLWSAPLNEGFGGAAIRDGEVYVLDRTPGEADVIRCYDFETGEQLWDWAHEVAGRLPYPGSRSTPTVEDKHVYAIGGFGHVYCVNRETHQAVWTLDVQAAYETTPPHFGYVQSPLIWEDLVIIAPMSEQVGLVALDKATGREVWRTGGLGQCHSTPTLNRIHGTEQLVFISRIDDGDLKQGLVSGLDPATGALLWSLTDYYVHWPIPGATSVADDQLFMTGGYGGGSRMFKLNKGEDGIEPETLFSLEKGSQLHQPFLYGDHLYVLVNESANQSNRSGWAEGGLMCIDLAGDEKWRTGTSPNFGRGNAILADDMFIIQDGWSGHLRLVEPNPQAYTQLAEANIFGIEDDQDHQMWAPMALADGKLILRSQSEMKCLDLRATAE